MWHLAKLALRSRVTTIIIAILLAGASIWALLGLKVELIPNISFPYATVVTIYPEATPDKVVNEVSAPIEKVIWDKWSGKGLKHVTSTSSKGMSIIMAEFEFGTDMTKVTTSLNEEIAQLSLPPEVTNLSKMMGSDSKNPQIIPINLSLMPLVSVSLSGDLPPEQLKQIADSQIIPKLKDVKGVLRVNTEGGEKDHVVITPDPAMMNRYGVSLAQIAGLLGSGYKSLDEIENTPLGTGSVKLADIARVSKGPPPQSVITRTNGKASVGISVVKEEKANTVDVANAVMAKVDELKGELGNGVEITTIFDQSNYIEDSINELWEKAIVGGVLAILVVFLFLWAVRASLITAISIPLSVLIGFLGMRLAGITINLLTLSAMTIAVGRLIDDSIVMVEVIFRRRQRGEDFKEAAIGGAKEVANPITSATLATVAIFIPIMFVGGIVGEMFIPFGLTVTFAMLASLLVALTIVPALSKLLVSGKSRVVNVRDNWYQKIYVKALRWSLQHRAAVLIITIALFAGSLGLIPLIGSSFMHGMGEKVISIDIQLPAKTEAGVTSETAAKVEALLAGNKAVKNYSTTIGTSTSMEGIMRASLGGGGTNTATITVYLNPGADLKKETEALAQACNGIADGGNIVVSEAAEGGPGVSTSGINVSVQGKNQADVAAVTAQLMDRLQGVKGLADLKSDLTTVVPRLNIAIDPAKIMTSGLPVTQMTQLQQEFVLLMMGSTVPGKSVTINNESYPIYIKGIVPELSSLEQAKALRVGYPQSVALENIASVTIQELPSHISHTDTSLSASITGTVTEKNVGAVNQAIQKEIDTLPAHPGVAIKMAGIAEQMKDTFSGMFVAIIVAVAIVFLIVILMMRSIRNPLMIMVSLPLAAIGALLGLWISGYNLSMSAMMGLLMLVGIVLTNAIVLITLVEYLRRGGMSAREALVEGGKTRLRPILMTALTTIIAMIPMAVGIGSGAMLTAELAIVVIGGLFSSTLLTLFVIPVIYSIAHRRQKELIQTH